MPARILLGKGSCGAMTAAVGEWQLRVCCGQLAGGVHGDAPEHGQAAWARPVGVDGTDRVRNGADPVALRCKADLLRGPRHARHPASVRAGGGRQARREVQRYLHAIAGSNTLEARQQACQSGLASPLAAPSNALSAPDRPKPLRAAGMPHPTRPLRPVIASFSAVQACRSTCRAYSNSATWRRPGRRGQ